MEHKAELYNDHKFDKKSIVLLQGIDDFTREDLDKLKQRRLSGTPEAILSICVSTTSACNIRCWYCYALDNKKPNPQQLTKAEYSSLIDEAVDLGARTMIVCGDGEPTYDKQLTHIIMHAHRCGLTPVVVTNGTMFGNDKAARVKHKLSGKGLAQFLYDHNSSLLMKLETLDPVLYEDIVKVKNAWEWFINGVDAVVETGFGHNWDVEGETYSRLSFTGIATKENIDQVPSLRAWAREKGAQFICKVPSPTGGALASLHKLFPPEKVSDIRNYVDNYTDKRETLTPVVLDGDRCMTCLAWHLGPVITETGHYVECYTSTDRTFGNIREKSLRQILLDKQKGTDFDNPCPIKDRLYIKLVQRQSTGAAVA